MKNEFFDSDACEFEVLGFFETLMDAKTHRVLGSRHVEAPTRPLGSDGLIFFDITQDTIVQRGHQTGVIKASPEKPVRVTGVLNILCGRRKASSLAGVVPEELVDALRVWEEAHRVWMNTPVHRNFKEVKTMVDTRARYEHLFDVFQKKKIALGSTKT